VKVCPETPNLNTVGQIMLGNLHVYPTMLLPAIFICYNSISVPVASVLCIWPCSSTIRTMHCCFSILTAVTQRAAMSRYKYTAYPVEIYGGFYQTVV
jgi:hypothetical protein